MNKLPTAERAKILEMMVEGVSIRAIARLTGASKNTVVKLLADAGDVCACYLDKHLRNLPCQRIQCDEIWSFCQKKEKRASDVEKIAGTAGDVWTWTAIDADSKLIVSWLVGRRDSEHGIEFVKDLKSRLTDRVQITTDSFAPYRNLVPHAFKQDVDYAMLVKIFRTSPYAGRYSPGECCGTKVKVIRGKPDPDHISTSYAERANLTMRMSMRRFTRLTNAFSKKVENHVHALAIYFMHYNFIRVHQSLRVTPAMEAGIAKSPLTMEDVVAMVDAANPTPATRGPYRKKFI